MAKTDIEINLENYLKTLTYSELCTYLNNLHTDIKKKVKKDHYFQKETRNDDEV